jgi:Mn2+/Fe2+ NRAMP family transporter
LKKFLKVLGPGLLYAGAAVGVSHLVQSTRAGALFNFDLVWVLILANILKYPFFEFGPRYATATGSNLVEGYQKVGKWAVVLFAVLSLASMFVIQAAVTVVTVGLFAYIFNLSIPVTQLSIGILILSVIILIIGKYSFLDKLIKLIIVLLAVSTLVAVFAALGIHKEISADSIQHFQWTKGADIFFLIAFVGWMPAPIDVSVWSSIWNLEKYKNLDFRPELKEALTEFRLAYIGTALLALGFLALGALVMFGTGEELSGNGTTFAGQLISMYTKSLGSWAYWIISIAAFTTMFSTTLTVLDAYSRVLTAVFKGLFPSTCEKVSNKNNITIFWLAIMVVGASVIIAFAAKTMVFMVTVATTLSFLTAPVLAWLNYRVVTDSHMPIEARPGLFLRTLSWIGIGFFVIFSLVYFYWRFIL